MTRVAMTTLRAALAACLVGLVLGVAAHAAPQQPQAPLPAGSQQRIADALKSPPAPHRLVLDGALPVATFRTSVEQHAYVPTLDEVLRKEFALTPFQRQAREWAAQCCGVNVIALVKSVDKILKRREERKIREQVLREIAELEAAARKGPRD